MSAEDNIKTVQAMYEAFGRGDGPAILEALVDDIDWATDTASLAAPWYGVRRTKEEVGRFFEAFGSTMEVEEFTPLTVAANDDAVLTVVRCRAKVRANGAPVDMNLHHYFRFEGPRVAYYRGTEDSAQVESALRA